MITAWRLCRHCFADMSGEGARRHGGRWNPKGHAVVYAAECLPLAVLESLVHLKERPGNEVFVQITFEEAMVAMLEVCYSLPDGWKQNEVATQSIGARWLQDATSAVLSVPSAVVAEGRNYLINPRHAAFPAICSADPNPFYFDDRLFTPRLTLSY